jgi:polysaccharide chain length determinant protein (PEP-CTERM system associated)
MEELLSQITSIARGMWKFRWTGLVVAWIVGIAASVTTLRVPDRYESMARIFVDTQSILKPLMSGLAVQPNIDQQVTMLSRTLISRPNIEKLVRMADLDLKSESKGQQDALVDSLLRNIEIRSAGRDNLYSLTYVDQDKDKAKRVIQSMVSIFVESSLGASRKDTDSAKVFIDEQIKTYEAKLEAAESRLKDFRLRNLDVQTGDGKDALGRLSEVSQQLEAAKLELSEAENSRDAALKQVEAERAALRGAAGSQGGEQDSAIAVATPEIDARIDAQKRGLDQLLQRFTEQHPDVINTRRLIKDLDAQKRKEVAELRKAALAAPASAIGLPSNSSLAMQELSKLLAASRVQVAGLKARVAEYQSRYAQARALSRTSPQIEAEAAQLNRDYGIVKNSYEQLVSRRQSAVMSGDLDMAAGVVDFRLIDPPRVSPRPVSPNRLMLLVGSLLAALAAGLVTTFAFSQLRPVFSDAAELRTKIDLPLLGVVSMILSDEDRKRNRANNIRFYLGTGSFFACFLVGAVTLSIFAARQVG